MCFGGKSGRVRPNKCEMEHVSNFHGQKGTYIWRDLNGLESFDSYSLSACNTQKTTSCHGLQSVRANLRATFFWYCAVSSTLNS